MFDFESSAVIVLSNKLSFEKFKQFDSICVQCHIYPKELKHAINKKKIKMDSGQIEQNKVNIEALCQNFLEAMTKMHHEMQSLKKTVTEHNKQIIYLREQMEEMRKKQERVALQSPPNGLQSPCSVDTSFSLHTASSAQSLSRRQDKINKLLKRNYRQSDYEEEDRKTEEMSEKIKVENWLRHKVRLPEYFALLVNNGYDDLETIGDMDMEDLLHCGVQKDGHRKKMMKYIFALNHDKIENKIYADSNNEAKVNEYDEPSHCYQYNNIWRDADKANNNLYLQSTQKSDII